jgi:hypothetical protein
MTGKHMQLHTSTRKRLDQQGIVSIMVAVILMAVMTLIVLSFAEISRRDQREALDRQLSSQAFYAAESGVNDAIHIIEADLNAGRLPPSKPSCGVDGVYVKNGSPASNVLNQPNQVSYPCLLIQPEPSTLVYNLTPGDASKVVPLQSSGGVRLIRSIELQWSPSVSAASSPISGCSTGTQLPPAASWSCGFGILRVDLVPIIASTSSRTGLVENDFTEYFVPSPGGTNSSANFNGVANLYGSTVSQGSMVNAGCANGATGCTMTINIPATDSARYYMRVSTIYRDTTLTISAYPSVNDVGQAIHLTGAQALIDVTGKAQDVLRRIQVRVPSSNNGATDSDYATVTTNSICKEFIAYAGSAADQSGIPECTLP